MSGSKAKKLLWFLSHPQALPNLARAVKRRLALTPREDSDSSRQAAEGWCRSVALPTAEIVERLCGVAAPERLQSLFPAELAGAQRAFDACPVRMGGPGNLDLLYHLTEHWKAEKVIETGVAYGWSSLALLLSLQHRNGAKLVSTDMPYAGAGNESFVGCVVPERLRAQWTLLANSDRNALPQALELQAGVIDVCHYDSDKSYGGRMWAYPLLWQALRPGGLFISDDIADNLAFREFAAGLKLTPLIAETDGKYVGLLVKPA